MADAPVDAERSRQPRSGNALTRGLGQSLLRLGGWRIDGTVPDEPKLLLLGAPHTSYFDFVLTKLTAWAVGVRLSWVGKKSLFPRPIAPLVRWYGGIPVNRETSEGFVAEIVAEFRQRDRFYLAMMPEGGIRTSRWRSGFYHIAQGAEVPMLLDRIRLGATHDADRPYAHRHARRHRRRRGRADQGALRRGARSGRP